MGTRIEPGGRVYSEESEYYALSFHLFFLRFGVLIGIAVDMGNRAPRFGWWTSLNRLHDGHGLV